MTNSILIAALDAEHALKKAKPASLDDALSVAFEAVYRHWLVTSIPEQFQAGFAGLLSHYGEGTEEWDRLHTEALAIKQINAMLTAAEAGLSITLPDPEPDPPEPVGLVGAWRAFILSQEQPE